MSWSEHLLEPRSLRFQFAVWSNMEMTIRSYPAAFQTEMQGHRQWWRINEVYGIMPEGSD